jgi:hypothetical protein
MAYKIKKHISQNTLVDLLEILMNKGNSEFYSAKEEFAKRKPSEKELEKAKKGLEIRLRARNATLSFVSKLKCLLIPFLYHLNSDALNDYENSQKEFENYGETRKVMELRRWQRYSLLFYFLVLVIFLIVFL